ncbi:MAG: hypothetical protein KDD82_21075 [Planctomycetes bacterium]|nr:hypothetical protein [Planctomycetota bacterium]
MTTPDAMLANLLAEVKLADKKLAQLAERRGDTENSIRAALRASDRPAAEKLALALERIKDEQRRLENQRAQAQRAYEQGKVKIRDLKSNLKSAQAAKHTLDALNAVIGAHGTLSAADDILAQIEQEVATNEARLEIAAEEAESLIEPEIDPKLLAESVLLEFEQGSPGKPAPRAAPPASKELGPGPGDDGREPPPGQGKSIG